MLPTRRGLKVLNVAAQPVLRTIGKVVGGDVLADAVAFFQAFAGHGDRVPRAGRRGDRAAAPATPPASCSWPRPEPTPSTRPATSPPGSREASSTVGAVVVNRCTPTFGDPPARATAARRRPGRPLRQPVELRSHRRHRARPRGRPARRRARCRRRAHHVRAHAARRRAHDGRRWRAIRSLLFPTQPGNVSAVHILVATDADYVVNDVTAALSGPDVRSPSAARAARSAAWSAKGDVDLAMLDLQIGSKGGMAVTMDLRLDESDGRVPAREGADAARPQGRRAPGQALGRRRLAGQAARPAAR